MNVGKSWVYQFLLWHPELKLGKLLGLDPNQVQVLNEAIVRKDFEELVKST